MWNKDKLACDLAEFETDVIGEQLDENGVIAARSEEMREVYKQGAMKT